VPEPLIYFLGFKGFDSPLVDDFSLFSVWAAIISCSRLPFPMKLVPPPSPPFHLSLFPLICSSCPFFPQASFLSVFSWTIIFYAPPRSPEVPSTRWLRWTTPTPFPDAKLQWLGPTSLVILSLFCVPPPLALGNVHLFTLPTSLPVPSIASTSFPAPAR